MDNIVALINDELKSYNLLGNLNGQFKSELGARELIQCSRSSAYFCTLHERNFLNYHATTTDAVLYKASLPQDSMSTCCFSNDESLVVAGSNSGVIYVWQTDTGYLLREFKLHFRRVKRLEFSDNDCFLCSASEDGSCYAFFVSELLQNLEARGTEVPTIFRSWTQESMPITVLRTKTHPGNSRVGTRVPRLSASCETLLVTCHVGSSLHLRLIVSNETNSCYLSLDGKLVEAYDCQFDHSGTRLFLGCDSGRVCWIDLTQELELKLLGTHPAGEVTKLDVTGCGKQLISLTEEDGLRIWSFQGQNLRHISLRARSFFLTPTDLMREPRIFKPLQRQLCPPQRIRLTPKTEADALREKMLRLAEEKRGRHRDKNFVDPGVDYWRTYSKLEPERKSILETRRLEEICCQLYDKLLDTRVL